jgi:hypothetical protein
MSSRIWKVVVLDCIPIWHLYLSPSYEYSNLKIYLIKKRESKNKQLSIIIKKYLVDSLLYVGVSHNFFASPFFYCVKKCCISKRRWRNENHKLIKVLILLMLTWLPFLPLSHLHNPNNPAASKLHHRTI